MDQRKAFLFFGFMVLVWMVFWNVAIRVSATRLHAKKGSSPALEGLAVAV